MKRKYLVRCSCGVFTGCRPTDKIVRCMACNHLLNAKKGGYVDIPSRRKAAPKEFDLLEVS